MSAGVVAALVGFAALAAVAFTLWYTERRRSVVIEEKGRVQDDLDMKNFEVRIQDMISESTGTLGALIDVKMEKYFGGEPVAMPPGEQETPTTLEERALGVLTDQTLANARDSMINEMDLTEKQADAAISDLRAGLMAERTAGL